MPGLASSTTGGIMDTCSCLVMWPQSVWAFIQAWKGPRLAFRRRVRLSTEIWYPSTTPVRSSRMNGIWTAGAIFLRTTTGL